MKTLALILICLCLCVSGCISQQIISEELARCPQFVQNNVGDIEYRPISIPSLLLMSGATHKPTGRVLLFALANRHAIFHEIGHSIYFRVPHDEFDRDFRKARGFVSIWSIGHYEKVAEAFVEGMKGRRNGKIDCAMRFFRGTYNE